MLIHLVYTTKNPRKYFPSAIDIETITAHIGGLAYVKQMTIFPGILWASRYLKTN